MKVSTLASVISLMVAGGALLSHGSESDEGVAQFRSFVSNSLARIQQQSELRVGSSHSLWVSDSDGDVLEVIELSYLTSGEHYRTICRWVQPASADVNEWQSSYNGVKGASFADGENTAAQLSYQLGDFLTDPVAPIHPVLAHLIYLSRAGDSCPACHLRINEIVTGDALRRFMQLTITNATVTSDPVLKFTLPSDTVDGESAYWMVEFDQAQGEGTVRSATRFINGGDVKLIYSFSTYTNLHPGGIRFPMVVTFTNLHHGSTIVMTGMTRVVSAEVDPEIGENAFDITRDLDSRARMVFNVDTETLDRKTEGYAANEARFKRMRSVIIAVLVALSAGGILVMVKAIRRRKDITD